MPTLRASVELLQQVSIFASLTEYELQQIIQSPDNRIVKFTPLEVIIEEDEIGHCMYIILDGTVDVRIRAVGGREITIATLKTGEFFGEQALLPGMATKRNASVRALQSCQLFKITKKDVPLGISHDEDLSVGIEDLSSASTEERVKILIRKLRLFRSLSKNDLDNIDSWTGVASYDAGEIVVRKAEEGDFMYIVLDGSVEVFVVDDDGRIVVLSELFYGDYFGEQALLRDSTGKRNANVRANGPAILLKVAKKYFQLIVNCDNRLMFALKAVGEAQRNKIVNAIG